MTASSRRDLLWLAAVTAAGFCLRLFCAAAHPPSGDEAGVVVSAINYLELGQLGPTMWNHPALRNILAYGMLRLLGPGLAGVIGLNLILGTLCIPLVHRVALRLTGERRVALTAALLFAVEPLAVQYSAQAINDIYLAFFPLAGILAAYRYLESGRWGWLVASGAAFGLGLGSKWSALFQLAVVGPLVLYRGLSSPGGRLPRAIFTVCALIVLPATVYLATFAPWFARGYSLSEWPALQKSMYRETKLHTGYQKLIYGDHNAGLWFIEPGISHQDHIFYLPKGAPSAEPTLRDNLTVLFTYANPLVWLAVIPSLLLVLLRARRERAEGLWVLAALLAVSYLPFAATGRPIWFNSGVVVLPYVVVVVAYAVWQVLPRVGTKPRRLYIVSACLVSLLLYPLAIGKGFFIPVVGDYLLEKTKHEQGESKENYERRGD